MTLQSALEQESWASVRQGKERKAAKRIDLKIVMKSPH
jgi:hypothetical protein